MDLFTLANLLLRLTLGLFLFVLSLVVIMHILFTIQDR